MGLLVTNFGERLLLEWALKSAGGALTLRLFRNDATILPTMVAADLTEANFTGYSARTLARATYSAAATNTGGVAEMAYSEDLVYTFGSDQSIFGFYLTDASGNLVAVNKFGAVRNFVTGAEYIIRPRFTFTSLGSAAAVVTDAGERILLDWILRGTGGALTLRLFKNNLASFTSATVVADLTQADFSGYAGRSLARASWNAAATDGAGVGQIEYNTDPAWTPASNQGVYGYYVTDASNNIIWGQKFSSMQNLESPETFTMPVTFGLRSEV